MILSAIGLAAIELLVNAFLRQTTLFTSRLVNQQKMSV